MTKQVSDAVFAQPQVQAINAAETEWLPKELATFKPHIDAGSASSPPNAVPFTASRAKVAEAPAHDAAKSAVATATAGGDTALAATYSDGGVAVTAEGVPVTPQKVGLRERVDVFVHTIDFHAALGGAAAG